MMTDPRLVGASPYETWVRTLRVWSQDPTTSLEHLPQLQDDTYSPQTFERLLSAIVDALEAVNERWLANLSRVIGEVQDSHELGRALVQLRPAIARSMQLASHPALPPAVRDAMQTSVRSSVERNQREFEETLEKALRRGNRSKMDQEQLLRTVRENSFVYALNHETVQTGERLVASALPVVTHQSMPTQPRRHRRIIL